MYMKSKENQFEIVSDLISQSDINSLKILSREEDEILKSLPTLSVFVQNKNSQDYLDSA